MMTDNTVQTLPKRDEIPEAFKWRLEDIYEDEALWEEDVTVVKSLIEQVQAYQNRLGESGEVLYEALELAGQLNRVAGRVFTYARMRRDEDNANTHYQGMTDRAMAMATQVGSAVSFIAPELLTIDEARLESFFTSCQPLELYRQYLNEILRQKPHYLSAKEEDLLARFSEVSAAPQNIFSMLNNADIKFPTIKDENGRDVEVTKGRYIQLMKSHDRRVRQDAFKALYDTYGKQINTLASILNASVKKDCFYANVRKYDSALAQALDEDNIPVEVYTNLIDTVHRYLPHLHRYIDLRKKLLGVDELHMYDLYVPIVGEIDLKIPYEKALAKVKASLAPLGEEYVNKLEVAFRSRWIDVHENEGKTSGAYSWGTYDAHPYVLLNYQETLDDVFTLTHEMGHALHSAYTNETQPYVYAGYTIFVAEVASTVNEALLTRYLLDETDDPQMKRYILNNYLEGFRGTLYRQTMFAEFEKLTHEAVEAGEALTPVVLKNIYRDLNAKYHGPNMVVDPEIEIEWARVPHFYRAFYVYKYATGFSAAVALSQQILTEGQPAVDRYIGFLKSGSSDYPLQLLQAAGVDMTTPTPVENALDVFASVLDELESLSS